VSPSQDTTGALFAVGAHDPVMTEVEAVLFDIDDTLCRYHRTATDLLPVAFERAGVDPFFDPETYVERYNEFADESTDVVDLRKRCFAAIARERGRDPEEGRAVARAYAAERDHTNVSPCPGAREALEALHGSVPLAAVTNGSPEMQATKLRTLDLAGYFETVVHGGYDAPAKPAPDPFYDALDAVDARPTRTVHVGNSLSSDVAGAKRAGLQAVWYAREDSTDPDPQPDYVVESMCDLASPPWD